MTDINELHNKCIDFHGHSCPGLATGFKVALIVSEEFGINLETAEDEELVCIAENDSCGLDAIQRTLGCTIGKGNLLLHRTGKQAWSFYDRRNGKSVRIVMKPFDRTKFTKEELIEKIISCPTEEMFEIKPVKLEVPEKAHMFNSVVCGECGEMAREDLMQLKDGVPLCKDCFKQYTRGWF